MAGRIARRAGILAAIGLLALAGCENSLVDYLYKGLFYNGWKVASWSAPAPVVDGFTHVQGTDYRNGFPMNMAMGSSGKLHLIGFQVSASPKHWLHTSMAAGAARFDQSYDQFMTIPNPGSDLGTQPGMDLISDDWLYIAYADNAKHLYFQEYSTVGGWRAAETLYTEPTNAIGRAFVFYLLTTSFKPHIFYVSNNTFFHTVRTAASTILPNPPETFISDVGSVRALRVGTNEIHFVWSDSAGQKLYHRRFMDSTVTEIWSNTDASLSIGELTLDNDLDGNLHVVFGTYRTAEISNTAFATLHYITNKGGSWQEKQSLTGTSIQGPMALIMPASIDVARDKNGNDHLHMAFTMWKPLLTFYLWYAYLDEAGWHVSDTSIDTVNANSFWTFPVIAVDPTGVVHIAYSWTQSELDRSMMYVRGTPNEPQQ
jgi:hypothetical protein